ncbi:MAG: hypothetical protein LBM26_00050 [Methanobrevibacter sp.]|jgi:hypothetical protein|nr:hypothetical protein [Methanobrevibacter sp.]
MTEKRDVKSLDLSSITIMGTSISFIWAIILSIIILIVFSFMGGFNIALGLIALAIIFGTLILSISSYFGISYLYNFIVKKIKKVVIEIEDIDSVKSIKSISILPFALITAIISLIIGIIIYPIIFIGLSLSAMPLIQSLLVNTATQSFGLLLYQIVMLAISPMTIVYAFVVPLLFTIIGSFVFNLIAPKVGGLKVELESCGHMTKLNSVNPINAGIITGVILLVFGLVIGLILAIIGGNILANLSLILILVLGGFAGGFIYGVLSSVFYNFIANKSEEVKLELPLSQK